MPNTHLLANMKCPNCGSEGPFRMVLTVTALVYDNDLDEVEYPKFTKDGYCQCWDRDCEFEGTCKDFGYTGD